jgi:hypothetical protein
MLFPKPQYLLQWVQTYLPSFHLKQTNNVQTTLARERERVVWSKYSTVLQLQHQLGKSCLL